MATRVATHIGTAGWQYKHWRRIFYPDDLATDAWLGHYARHFDCVEVNSSFYGMPSAEVIRQWCERTPAAFSFAVKAPRRITHFKKLKNCQLELHELLARLDCFEDKLGPVLFQLPPRWRCNLRRLTDFLAELPARRRFAFEFRDSSWHNDEVYAALAEHDAAFCIFDLDGVTTPLTETATFVYMRLHGPRAAYTGNYHARNLRTWVARALTSNRKGKDAYVFFDNDEKGYAVKNARRALAFLQED
jgi:uncharacterized protein YecE (DUF72 family)